MYHTTYSGNSHITYKNIYKSANTQRMKELEHDVGRLDDDDVIRKETGFVGNCAAALSDKYTNYNLFSLKLIKQFP